MSNQIYDVCVIGAGPGGYVACIHAAQHGLSVVSVEARLTLGGTCLNEGCIPSKALLHSSHLYHEICHHGLEHGIEVQSLALQLQGMMQRKDKIVQKNTSGIDYLYKKYGIEHVCGYGRLTSEKGQVQVKSAKGDISIIQAKHIILATGSEIIELSSIAPFDHQYVCNSTDALSFDCVPKTLAVVGGGVIGLELGSVWQRLGSEVTVIEASSSLIGGFDASLSRFIRRHLEKLGMKMLLSTQLKSVDVLSGSKKSRLQKPVVLKHQNKFRKGAVVEELAVDRVLVCVGRKPHTSSLGLEEQSIRINKQGYIRVSDCYETSSKHVYAIGDVIGGAMLAHKAEREAIAVVDHILGKSSFFHRQIIPNVVYTSPELASVGQTEAQLKKQNVLYKTGMFHLKGNARSQVYGEDTGFVRLYAHSETDEILGAHIAAPAASELIAELACAMNFSASAEDLARTTHAHPSVSETIKEAALAVNSQSLHS